MSTIAHTSHMDIFQNLAVDLDTEGRYLFLNSLANQLRFPSSHTHYFSLVILYLFAQSNTEVVQVRFQFLYELWSISVLINHDDQTIIYRCFMLNPQIHYVEPGILSLYLMTIIQID
jgi:hypothetical protein